MKSHKTHDQDKRTAYYWSQVQQYGKKRKWFHWHSVELILNLTYTYDVLSSYLSEMLFSKGISRTTFNILNIISRSGKKGCTQKELGELLLVSRANVTEVIDNLVRRHLVVREYSHKDRRTNFVKITKKGEKLLNVVVPFYYKVLRKVVSSLSSRQAAELNKLLTSLRLGVFDLKKDSQLI
jgi:MarR family 2-MHQ and catechol resistance regulon transcriptional repressor